MPRSLSEILRAECNASWSESVDHRFMRSLRDGSLSSDTFARFLLQDYRFVERLLVLLATAITLADSLPPRLRIARAMGGLAESEDSFFKEAFRALNVDEATVLGVSETEPNRKFASLMQEAAATGSYAGVIAVLCQADWLYLDCAAGSAQADPGSLHMRWIAQYSNEEVRSFITFLRAELDRTGWNDEARARSFFVRANRLEVEFLDAVV